MKFASLPDAIEAHARDAPGRLAVTAGERTWTYGELWRAIERATEVLAGQGIAAGDRVAFLGLNDPGQLIALGALMRLGAMLVPLNYRLAAAELRAIVEHAGASLLIADDTYAPVAAGLGVRTMPRDSLTSAGVAQVKGRA